MSDASPPPAWICPRCGADFPEPQRSCSVCAGLGLPSGPATGPPGPQIRIGTLMLLIAGIAVALVLVMAIGRDRWPLLVLLALPTAAATVRTLAGPNGRGWRPPTPWDHVWTFVRSFLVATAVLLASGIAFFASCSAVVIVVPPRSRRVVDLALIVGAVAGLASLIGWTTLLVRSWWRERQGPYRGKP